jgi:hypothetical protein
MGDVVDDGVAAWTHEAASTIIEPPQNRTHAFGESIGTSS